MRKVTFVLIVFVLNLSLIGIALSQDEEQYVISIPMLTGMEATSMTGLMEQLVVTLGEKADLNLSSKTLVYDHGESLIDHVKDEFTSGKSHISFVTGIEYAQNLIDGKKDLVPIVTMAINGSDIQKACFYTRTGEYKSVKELKGKIWGGANALPTRVVMYAAGVDEPVESFFSKLIYKTDSPSNELVSMLENKQIDVFATYESVISVAGYLNKKDVFFEPLFCSTIDYTWVFVATPDMPAESISKLKEVMLGAHKDPYFKQFHFMFKMLKGRFKNIDEDSFKEVYDLVLLMGENGWYDEEKAFHKKYGPFKSGK